MNGKPLTLVAFLSVCTTQDGQGYLGGLLVTDETGVPKEFRCTHAIRPTGTQKALYGDTLKPHLFYELLGLPLIRALSTSPAFCCVADPVLLRVRDDVNLPVFHLQRLGDVLSVTPTQADGSSSAPISRRIDSQSGGFQPILATALYGYESDLEAMNDELHRVFSQVDLVEPFDRIAIAMKALSERDERFR